MDKHESIEDVKAEAERLTLERLKDTLAAKKEAQEKLDAVPEAEVVTKKK